ncbi:MAG: metallophosphoesterase [Planctomycetes bacterium]|nr:metallophosphoesterase [Planctomycetota bacterium]
MKFFVTSDLHGNLDFYENSLKLARDENCQVAVVAGNLLPDGFSLSLSLGVQLDFIDEGLKYYLEEFNKADIQVILLLGNHDWAFCETNIKELEKQELCVYAHKKLIDIVGTKYQLVGYNCVPQTNFYRKDWERLEHRSAVVPDSVDFFTKPGVSKIYTIDAQKWFDSKSTIEDDLMTLPTPQNWHKTIAITHAPPKQTPLDRNYQGDSVGSSSVKNFLLSRNPYLSIHGNVHESPKITGIYNCMVGSTMSINVGQQLGIPSFHACTFSLEDVPGTIKHTVFDSSRKLSDKELFDTGAIP